MLFTVSFPLILLCQWQIYYVKLAVQVIKLLNLNSTLRKISNFKSFWKGQNKSIFDGGYYITSYKLYELQIFVLLDFPVCIPNHNFSPFQYIHLFIPHFTMSSKPIYVTKSVTINYLALGFIGAFHFILQMLQSLCENTWRSMWWTERFFWNLWTTLGMYFQTVARSNWCVYG